MADCQRVAIPTSLIESKGDFKCDNLYVPTSANLVGYRGSSQCLDNYIPDLSGTIPVTFDMTSISYNDEFMSWQSEVFTVPSYVPPPNSANYSSISPACYGLCQTGEIGSPCVTIQNEDNGYWTGQTFDMEYYGRTIQFFFNIYKKYCCTLNAHGDVIDYDYQYYWIKLQKLDDVLCDPHGWACGCGEIDFCSPTFDISSPTCPCLFGVRNF